MRRKLARTLVALALLALPLAGACADDDGGPGIPDGTCFDCATVCVACDAALEQGCLAKCDECQGTSDCFMWLEAHLASDWGCSGDHTTWSDATCP